MFISFFTIQSADTTAIVFPEAKLEQSNKMDSKQELLKM